MRKDMLMRLASLARFLVGVSLGSAWPLFAADKPSGMSVEQARKFWSFQPVRKPPEPTVRNQTWPKTAVDKFILSHLENAGLQPGSPADKRTLIRRATFDLIGLPPTPEEVESFENDHSAGAFAKVIERLLASPHYGERWGRHWLDVVRYADTAGETADYPAPEAYRYRNYVIDAFNHDKPYDQFIREQIAGDILARHASERGAIDSRRYAELITATGFLAISRRFGFDTEKYEHLTIQDTIDTVGQAFQGLSFGCARCHDHKYDPVSMEDYYGLYGFFASTRYAFAGSERLQKVRSGVPLIAPKEASRRWSQWERQVNDLEAETTQLRTRYTDLENKAGVTNKAKFPPLEKVTIRPLTDLDGDFELQAPPSGGSMGLPANPWRFSGGVRIDKSAQSPFVHLCPSGASGASFPDGLGDALLGQGLVPSKTSNTAERLFFSIDFRALPKANSSSPGSFRVYLGHGIDQAPAVELFISGNRFYARNGGRVELIRELKPGAWHHVQLEINLRERTYQGSVGARGELTRFADKTLAPGWDGKIDYFQIDGRGNVPGPRPGLHIDNVAISETPFAPLTETLAQAPNNNGVAPANASATELSQLRKRIDAAQTNLAELVERGPFPMAYAAWEGTPHDAAIQKRGEPDQPGDMARRRFPAILGGGTLPQDVEGSGRLELANWLARPENPLTARVLVNRVWQHHFGNGLANTENDFGLRGQPPTHPEFLDGLAWQFMDQGWSIKALHRMIVLSATYQQTSTVSSQAAMVDPANALLSRYPRRRLDAESIRDALLAAGGNLETGPSGPHPFPKTQKLAFTQHSPFRAVYETNRRSVYLMTQRLRRHPFLALFDGADPNASTAERSETTVPTQALFMMNDPFVHAQAAALGQQLLAHALNDSGRVRRAFEIAFARGPNSEEERDGIEFLQRYRRELSMTAGAEGEREKEVWAAFARTLFARNEFIYVD